MSYKPYLIADFKTGIELDKEPWLLPKDAFTKMENAYLYEGVITKRRGYTEFGRLQHSDPQDVSAYTEVDVGAVRFNPAITATTITVLDLDTDEDVWCYWDTTVADYFKADDEFELDFKCTDGGTGRCGFWAITQDVDGFYGLTDNDKNFLALFHWNDKLQIYARSGVSSAADLSAALTIGTDYWLTIKVDRTAGI